jgi:selenocysteine lyase/cysteine desulfurase
VAFVRCSKRRGGTPTGERAAISARRAEARIVDYASAGVPPSFLLFSFLFLRCFFLGFAGLDRDERPDSTAGFAPGSLESRRFVPFSCRLPHASDAGRIARTMPLALSAGRFRAWRRTPVSPERIRLSLRGKLVWCKIRKIRMLPSQRALFDIPADICYLNAASYSPLPLKTLEAASNAVARKGRPWLIDNEFAAQQYDRTRRAAAALINAAPEDVALISSVGYGVSTAAKIFAVPAGSRVLVLQDDHSSAVLEWMTRAGEGGFTVETVRRSDDGDWTAAVLNAIERPGAAPIAIASISSVHWSDGGVIDLGRVAPALRDRGAALLVDATHSAGVLELDVQKLDPDFVVFPTYKWLIGPYARAFLYVAKRHQGGIPLEQTSYGRRAVRAEQDVYFTDTNYVGDARRFDMGERDHFISMEMAAIGMEMMAQWGRPAIVERLAMLTGRLAEGLRRSGVDIPDARLRAPHILSLGFPGGMPRGLVAQLAAKNVYVAPRLGQLRISPHVYNDEVDVDRFIEVFRKCA